MNDSNKDENIVEIELESKKSTSNFPAPFVEEKYRDLNVEKEENNIFTNVKLTQENNLEKKQKEEKIKIKGFFGGLKILTLLFEGFIIV